MIVSHRLRFIFFHNPKCAGTSVRQILQAEHDDLVLFRDIKPAPFLMNDLDHSHLRLWEMRLLYPAIIEAARSYRSVILVRNPWRRFVSALDEHFKLFHPMVPLAAMSPEQQVRAIEIFIEQGIRVDQITTNYRFVHFSPQLWFIRLGDTQIPGNVLPMTDGGDFMASVFSCLGLPPREVPKVNTSRLDLTHVLTSPKIANFVREFYAMDFWYLAGNPTLRHLTRPPI